MMVRFRIVDNAGLLKGDARRIEIIGRDIRGGGTEVSLKDLLNFLEQNNLAKRIAKNV